MTYEIIWTPTAADQLQFWRTTNLKKVEKIKKLCESIICSPEQGIGRPERLKFFNENVWSRRIDQEHRLVYQIKNNAIYILQCRYHY